MLQDEVHDGFWIFEAVGVVADAFLADDFNLAAEFLIALLDDVGVLGDGDDVIGLANHVEEGDFCFGERGEVVDGAAFVGFGFFGGEIVGFENLGFDAGPAFEITNGCVGVDAGDFVGIFGGPVVDDEAATGHAFEGGFFGEAVVGDKVLVELVPSGDGFGCTVESGDVAVGDVESLVEKGDVGLGFVSKEAGAPNPGFAFCGFFRDDDFTGDVVVLEIEEVEAVEGTLFTGPGGFGEGGEGEDQEEDGFHLSCGDGY